MQSIQLLSSLEWCPFRDKNHHFCRVPFSIAFGLATAQHKLRRDTLRTNSIATTLFGFGSQIAIIDIELKNFNIVAKIKE